MNEKQRQRAYYFRTLGREARRNGILFDDNPYPRGGETSRAWQWDVGWLLEDDKIRNEKKEEQNGQLTA